MKECHFCKSSSVRVETTMVGIDYMMCYVVCLNCGASGPCTTGAKEAIAAWDCEALPVPVNKKPEDEKKLKLFKEEDL